MVLRNQMLMLPAIQCLVCRCDTCTSSKLSAHMHRAALPGLICDGAAGKHDLLGCLKACIWQARLQWARQQLQSLQGQAAQGIANLSHDSQQTLSDSMKSCQYAHLERTRVPNIL